LGDFDVAREQDLRPVTGHPTRFTGGLSCRFALLILHEMWFIKESGVVDGKVRQTFRFKNIDDSGFIPTGRCEILDVIVGLIG